MLIITYSHYSSFKTTMEDYRSGLTTWSNGWTFRWQDQEFSCAQLARLPNWRPRGISVLLCIVWRLFHDGTAHMMIAVAVCVAVWEVVVINNTPFCSFKILHYRQLSNRWTCLKISSGNVIVMTIQIMHNDIGRKREGKRIRCWGVMARMCLKV